MKSDSFIIKRNISSRQAAIAKPAHLSELTFEDLYKDNTNWQEKSQRLQARRWRKIKYQKV